MHNYLAGGFVDAAYGPTIHHSSESNKTIYIVILYERKIKGAVERGHVNGTGRQRQFTENKIEINVYDGWCNMFW